MFKSLNLAILLSLLASLVAKAEIPQKTEFKNYSHLLQRSPFLIKINKMVKPIDKPVVRKDYFLRGVIKLETGWMVIIVDRKQPKKNIIAKQGEENTAGIDLVDVMQNLKNYKLTEAKVKIASQEMTIGYNTSDFLKTGNLASTTAKDNYTTKQTNLADPNTIKIRQAKPSADLKKNRVALPPKNLEEESTKRTRPTFE